MQLARKLFEINASSGSKVPEFIPYLQSFVLSDDCELELSGQNFRLTDIYRFKYIDGVLSEYKDKISMNCVSKTNLKAQFISSYFDDLDQERIEGSLNHATVEYVGRKSGELSLDMQISEVIPYRNHPEIYDSMSFNLSDECVLELSGQDFGASSQYQIKGIEGKLSTYQDRLSLGYRNENTLILGFEGIEFVEDDKRDLSGTISKIVLEEIESKKRYDLSSEIQVIEVYVFYGSKFLINDQWKRYEAGSLGSSLNAKTQVLSVGQTTTNYTLKECVSKDSSLIAVSDRSFYYCYNLNSISLLNVTSIGNYAFYNCTRLNSVNLPNATSIGSQAFYYCTGLTSISFPNVTKIGGSTFQNCRGLNSVNLPNATSFGGQAFYYCTGLTSISLPKATSITNSTFRFSSKLSSIYVNNSTLHSIGNGYGIDNQLIVNNDETNVVIAAPAITHINNDTITSISQYAFGYCTSLTSVSLPNVTSIGNYAFYNCTRLSSVSLPNATSIGSDAFGYCTSLTSVSLPNVTSIGNYAFYNCTRLSSVSLPNATSIGSDAFNNCTSLTSISLPNATSISQYAFYYCTSLSSIYVNNSTLHSIGNGYGIDNQLVVNNNETAIIVAAAAITQVSNDIVTSISSYAFCRCTNLSSVNLPIATSIGSQTFSWCTSLSSITLGNTTQVVTLDNTNAFNCLPTNYKVYVPSNLYNDYIVATNWSSISSHIDIIQS